MNSPLFCRLVVGAFCVSQVLSSSTVFADSSGASDTVPSQAISVPKGQGSIEGMGESFSAQLATGLATAGVPIASPSPRGNVSVGLSLAYSSGAAAGLAGMGWDLTVPSIARQSDRGTPQYQDGTNGQWSPNQDRFVYSGGELVPICTVMAGKCSGASDETMPPWADNWQYFRVRVESQFLRFFWSPNHETWRIQSRNGGSIELGVPMDGSKYRGALEQEPANPERIYRWKYCR